MPSATTATPHPLPSQGRGQGERSIPHRQRAFTLYCEGHRSPAIAARLGVPERTIRAWVSADLRALAAESSTHTRQELLQLAITRQLAIATAAWDAYHAANTHHEPNSSPPMGERSGERYLRLAHAAYREIDRLQGLYLPAPAEPQQVRIILERLPNDDSPATADAATPASAAETATPPAPHHHELNPSLHRNGERGPAETATPSHFLSAQADIVGDDPSGAVSTAGSPPAESATATPPPPRRGEWAGGEVAPTAPACPYPVTSQPSLPTEMADAPPPSPGIYRD